MITSLPMLRSKFGQYFGLHSPLRAIRCFLGVMICTNGPDFRICRRQIAMFERSRHGNSTHQIANLAVKPREIWKADPALAGSG